MESQQSQPQPKCLECQGAGWIQFYDFVESMIYLDSIPPISGLESGGEYQMPCPICNSERYYRYGSYGK